MNSLLQYQIVFLLIQNQFLYWLIPLNFALRKIILLIKIPSSLIFALRIFERHRVRKIILINDLSVYNQVLKQRYLWLFALYLCQVAIYMVMLTCVTWERFKWWFIILLLLILLLFIYNIYLLIVLFLFIQFLLFFFLI